MTSFDVDDELDAGPLPAIPSRLVDDVLATVRSLRPSLGEASTSELLDQAFDVLVNELDVEAPTVDAARRLAALSLLVLASRAPS